MTMQSTPNKLNVEIPPSPNIFNYMNELSPINSAVKEQTGYSARMPVLSPFVKNRAPMLQRLTVLSPPAGASPRPTQEEPRDGSRGGEAAYECQQGRGYEAQRVVHVDESNGYLKEPTPHTMDDSVGARRGSPSRDGDPLPMKRSRKPPRAESEDEECEEWDDFDGEEAWRPNNKKKRAAPKAKPSAGAKASTASGKGHRAVGWSPEKGPAVADGEIVVKTSKTASSGYVGVDFHEGKWRARVRVGQGARGSPNRIVIGRYSTAREAAVALAVFEAQQKKGLNSDQARQAAMDAMEQGRYDHLSASPAQGTAPK